ncbi:MAG: NAD(P)-dependent oxidoreductase [Planctomycetota bacterium]|jgi:phosphoglycerate dehydrogenase-like enzyme
MTLRVYMPRTPGPEFEAALRARLLPEVDLVTGEARPAPSDYAVLVAGRPRAEDLTDAPALRHVVIPYAGAPHETLAAVRGRKGVSLHNLHHNAAATAEMAVALLLAAARRIVPMDRALRSGDWRPRYADPVGRCLAGRRALLLGYGAVGRRVAKALRGLGLEIDAVRRHGAEAGIWREAEDGVRVYGPASIDDLLAAADVVVITLPGTPETKGLLDARRLALLPRGALLVNVGRGEIVDEEALYDALKDGALGGAGLDVWYRYPRSEAERGETLPSAFPLHELDTVVMSPHRAGMEGGTEPVRARHLADLLNAAARGEEVPNRVDLDAGY